jgi:K(+)-stimulated pyrophosphate-energized sodium pump
MAGPSSSAVPSTAAALFTSTDRTVVIVIAAVAVAALVVAWLLVRQVRAADQGTEGMKRIASAVQEGADAYLARQFRTLGGFAGAVVFLLLLLPADDWTQRFGRSVFFLVGAVFSAVTGYAGMQLAVSSNVRVAAAARAATAPAGTGDTPGSRRDTPEPGGDTPGSSTESAAPGAGSADAGGPAGVSHRAMRIAFRTGGCGRSVHGRPRPAGGLGGGPDLPGERGRGA